MYILIVNPISGQGAALRHLDEVKALFERRNLEYRVVEAAATDEATRTARTAVEDGAQGVVALGGDGTLFAIANGMAGSDVPLLFAPCGTGNDFVRMLDLPKDPVQALEMQLDAPVGSIDVGKMNDTCFLNVSGTGFDVEVLRYVDAFKEKHSGLKAYMLALVKAIRNYKPMTAHVSIDGGEEVEMQFAILSVGNGRYIGSGMLAVPDATVNDGYFDVVVVSPVRKIMILPLIAFYIFGKHLKLKLAKSYRCKSLRLRRPGSTFNLDGELICADSAEYKLLPGALRVQIPSLAGEK